MLRTILAITGRPGLYKILTQNSKSLLVEELGSGKRLPVGMRDKVISLGDIAMYTEGEDKPLGEILDLVYAKHEGKTIDLKKLIKENGLRDEFRIILPDFDEERVYITDIKKLFNWYNILIGAGFNKFTEDKEAEEASKED
ncbi:MAG: DUF5606 domain-containing protein [Prevotella sp.]|nr:DUF5606 domain-containing protein [Bacteroides sp.]MCM1365675.1 DUF5606 domain-containing protein [Prevotella sp.]